MTLNNNIRSLRLQKSLSQEALGEQLGVTAQAVSKWEQGITSPDISLLPHLAACFGVTIDCLFAGADTRRYPGYGSERAELLAIYESKEGTEADFRRAADAYSEVILSGKATPEDYQSYGILHKIRAFRDIEIALHYYRRAIAEGQEHRDLQWQGTHACLINLLTSLGRLDKAIEENRKWCEEEPDYAQAHVYYAYALKRAGRLDEAWQETEIALSLAPEDGNVHTMAGDLCAGLGRYEEAISHWDKAYAAEPSCISCLFSKAEMFASIGQKDRAISQYEEILAWLESHGYNMDLEGVYPRQRIREIQES